MIAIPLLLLLLQDAPPAADRDWVRLDFPDVVELPIVVDYVAAALQLNILYEDSAVAGKKISLRLHRPVERSALLGVLRNALRMHNLVLVATEDAGWLKILPADRLQNEARALTAGLPPPGTQEDQLVSYVLTLRYADPQRVQAALTPLLSKPGGSAVLMPEARSIVLTDQLATVRRTVALASELDQPPAATEVARIAVQHQDAADVAAAVGKLLSERGRLDSPTTAPLSVQIDPLGDGLLAIGTQGQVEAARRLVAEFDVAVTRTTEVYQPRYLTAGRARALLEQFLGSGGLRWGLDEESNILAITATPAQHTEIAKLLARFDSEQRPAATPLRLYKLMNRRADDVFATLAALLATAAPASGASGSESIQSKSSESDGPTPGVAQALPPQTADAERPAGATPGTAPRSVQAVQGGNYSLAVDVHTNAILAVAPPELHRQIATLIAQLDKRRPQVLVEVTLVSINADDSLNLGVELQTVDLADPWNFLLYSSFGLSTVDPTTGRRNLAPAPGGTGVLLAPDEVPIILQALQTQGKTRVYSAPRILVDDNASGTIESVAEAPFTSVNAANTIATTSFAGFAKAGTQLTIEPHIAEGDHLEIVYSLTVSSFTGAGSTSAPPPRSSDTIRSTIRVPDGYTVVVGGLLTETLAESVSQVPLLGEIPALGLLFGSRSQSQSKVRLYAFIRPTVLRHEGFEDLKYLSNEDLSRAGVEDGFPPTQFQYMR